MKSVVTFSAAVFTSRAQESFEAWVREGEEAAEREREERESEERMSKPPWGGE